MRAGPSLDSWLKTFVIRNLEISRTNLEYLKKYNNSTIIIIDSSKFCVRAKMRTALGKKHLLS